MTEDSMANVKSRGHQNKRYWPHNSWGTERLYYASHGQYNKGRTKLAGILKYINVALFRCYIDYQALIGERLDLPHGGFGLVVGSEVTIGDDAIIFHAVTIGSARPGPVVIGDRVYIGTGATILGPVTIGNDVTIGANAVVTFDVPDGMTVVAQKARILDAKS